MKNLESPQILSDLYRDLRDRRLLPLVVVLIVGIAIVPIALSKSPEPSPPPVAPSPVAAKSDVPAQQVVVSDPGLRNYKKRLAGDAPRNPFIQQFAAPTDVTDSGASGDTGSAGTGTTTSGTSSSGTTTGSDTSSGSTTPSPGGTTTSGGGQTKYYTYRVKVRAGQLDGKPLKVYDSVGTLSNLPSNKIPAVSFLGVTKDEAFNAKTAVFLVSSAVSSVDGEGHCSFAGTACQLLSLKPGEHEDLVWSDGLTYRIELVKFDLTSLNHLPSAGNSKSGSNGNSGAGRSSQKQTKDTGFYFSF
jgi:hypothetical protein